MNDVSAFLAQRFEALKNGMARFRIEDFEGQSPQARRASPECPCVRQAGHRCPSSPGLCVSFLCSGMKSRVRMLCSLSASFTSSTRMSFEMASRSLRRFSAWAASFDTRSSRLILVRPSTRRTDFGAEKIVNFGFRRLGVFDRVMQQRGDDGGIVELEFGEDGGNFERDARNRPRRTPASGCHGRAWRRHRPC